MSGKLLLLGKSVEEFIDHSSWFMAGGDDGRICFLRMSVERFIVDGPWPFARI
jgi:hypothetical protein